jgi:hypothetical protein
MRGKHGSVEVLEGGRVAAAGGQVRSRQTGIAEQLSGRALPDELAHAVDQCDLPARREVDAAEGGVVRERELLLEAVLNVEVQCGTWTLTLAGITKMRERIGSSDRAAANSHSLPAAQPERGAAKARWMSGKQIERWTRWR